MLTEFLEPYSAEKMMSLLSSRKAAFWAREGERRALHLFHAAAEKVPAYKDFLRLHRVNHRNIKTISDFQLVPTIDKNSYLRKYPLKALSWNGTLQDQALVFTATSGSTGKPFYFPRDEALDWQSSVSHEIFLRNTFTGKPRSTLVVVCFGMGVWIGGLITYQAFRSIALRGYPVTIITPGTNKKEIFEAVKHLAGNFDQVILCGYPPFIKDVIDEGVFEGINWKKINLKLLFAAEAFSDKLVQYLARVAGLRNPYRDVSSIYGSADLGTMAQKTPLSIFIKKTALAKPDVFSDIFPGISKTPTLAQFNPLFTYFEAPAGTIVCTGYNAVPLIRYAIGDHGGVLDFPDMLARLAAHGVDARREARRLGIRNTINQLPFVYVYERSDLSTKLYGAIVYPEHIREALHDRRLEAYATGKFTVVTRYDQKQNQPLKITVELRLGVRPSDKIATIIQRVILQHLLEKNAEYKVVHATNPVKLVPSVACRLYGDPEYFGGGTKQKWVQKI